jgi:hypothetical protein
MCVNQQFVRKTALMVDYQKRMSKCRSPKILVNLIVAKSAFGRSRIIENSHLEKVRLSNSSIDFKNMNFSCGKITIVFSFSNKTPVKNSIISFYQTLFYPF